MCPLVRVELREEPSELEQHGDAAAVGVCSVGQPLSGTGGRSLHALTDHVCRPVGAYRGDAEGVVVSYDHNGGQIFPPDPSETTLVGKDGEISHRSKRKSLQRGGISVCSVVLDYATLLIPLWVVRLRHFLLVSTQRGDLRVATLISCLRCFAAFLTH